ncbi:tripartite tricarboxylate transporter TctB family protein [Polynucleobacter acidiphobus]|uniref:tripartite tricarboxylate transporter TctB family protein n=1 Tax=Polynucleobacter acidiphobus TaxID=556053 RepID=UPI000D36EEC3|nr:tripartite tricarboxylate transporter TctB family protein [Polynucleobacter acidiphobus]
MSEQSNQNALLSMRTAEILVSLTFLVFAIVIMQGSIKLGSSWGSDGPQAGYFPFYISLIILISSAATLIQAIRQKELSNESFVDKGPFRQVLAVLVPAFIFVLLMQLIGIYVSAAIYIAFFMIWIGKYAAWKSITLGVAVSVALYMMFEYWFQIPLPSGSLINPLALVGIQ